MCSFRLSTSQARPAAARRRWMAMATLLLGCGVPAICAAQSQWGPAAASGNNVAMPQSVLRIGLAAGTHIVYEPRPFVPPNELQTRAPQQPSLALEFKSPKKDQGPRSLLRVQLSGDSVLHFRPRGGGLTVTYKSQF